MATSQGQDIIRCQLCPEPVEHHCNLCHVDLCVNCVSKHLTDKSKRHEVVDFINKKEELILPECKSHNKTPCEMYCNDCLEPTCVMCVTTTHKKHDLTDIKSIVENLKRHIIIDVEELENTILPTLKKDFLTGVSSKEFDKVMDAIQDQEDTICKAVRKIGRHLKDEVAKEKREFEESNNEAETSAATTERKLNKFIRNNKKILKSNDAKCILAYKSKNEDFKDGLKEMQILYPVFLSGTIKENQLQEMFGSLQRSSNLTQQGRGKLGMQKLMTNPYVLSTIKTPYGNGTLLWRILWDKTGKTWISGNDSTLYQIDRIGTIHKGIDVSKDVFALSIGLKNELLFSLWRPDTKIYKYDGGVLSTVVDLGQWCPCGLCHSANGDLLVSMRSLDKSMSRLKRFSAVRNALVITNDSQGRPLFSVGAENGFLLAENGNGDICVADYAGNAVVVVDASGKLRFKYYGNISSKSNKTFIPSRIATDVYLQILINDVVEDIVHVIDSNGNFLSYIEYPCTGGLSIDSSHNLMVGDLFDGIIRIIKYLK